MKGRSLPGTPSRPPWGPGSPLHARGSRRAVFPPAQPRLLGEVVVTLRSLPQVVVLHALAHGPRAHLRDSGRVTSAPRHAETGPGTGTLGQSKIPPAAPTTRFQAAPEAHPLALSGTEPHLRDPTTYRRGPGTLFFTSRPRVQCLPSSPETTSSWRQRHPPCPSQLPAERGETTPGVDPGDRAPGPERTMCEPTSPTECRVLLTLHGRAAHECKQDTVKRTRYGVVNPTQDHIYNRTRKTKKILVRKVSWEEKVPQTRVQHAGGVHLQKLLGHKINHGDKTTITGNTVSDSVTMSYSRRRRPHFSRCMRTDARDCPS